MTTLKFKEYPHGSLKRPNYHKQKSLAVIQAFFVYKNIYATFSPYIIRKKPLFLAVSFTNGVNAAASKLISHVVLCLYISFF